MTTYECLERAARTEDLARKLYARIAEGYEGNPPFRSMFLRLAAEEEQHALRIRMLLRHAGRAAWPPSSMEAICREVDEAEREFREMISESETRVRTHPTADVLRWVMKVETRFASIHAEAVAGCLEPEVQRLFASLARQDALHRSLLERNAVPALA